MFEIYPQTSKPSHFRGKINHKQWETIGFPLYRPQNVQKFFTKVWGCLSGSNLEHQALPGAKTLQICSPWVSDWICVWDFENYFSASKKLILKFLIFFRDFSIFGGCQWFPIVISIGFGEIWTKIRQNPENFRKINLSRPPEGVGRRAWPFLNATCRGESISEVYVAIWKHLEHENLKKHDFHDFLQKFEKSTLLLLWPPL